MKYVSSALVASVLCLGATACGGSDESSPVEASTESADPSEAVETEAAASSIDVVSANDAAATIASPPDGLVILDVRTPEEFAEGHVDGAVLLDFYRDDFAEELARLDRDAPYVIYCRSGNRSGQTRALMADLGFAAVDDIDGGIIAWEAAGLDVTAE